GLYPLQAPATAEILKGIPLASFDIDSELTKPTGAAFIKALASKIGPLPSITIVHIGYGCGTEHFDYPYILRSFQFNTKDNTPTRVQVIECQIDDMSAEKLSYFL